MLIGFLKYLWELNIVSKVSKLLDATNIMTFVIYHDV